MKEPPVLPPNEIDAMYKQMAQAGWKYVDLMQSVTLDEWRIEELRRYNMAKTPLNSHES